MQFIPVAKHAYSSTANIEHPSQHYIACADKALLSQY